MHLRKSAICLSLASIAMFALVGPGAIKNKSVGLHTKRSLLKAFVYANKVYNKNKMVQKPDCEKVAGFVEETKSCVYTGTPGQQGKCIARAAIKKGAFKKGRVMNAIAAESHVLDAKVVTFPEEQANTIANDIVSICLYGVPGVSTDVHKHIMDLESATLEPSLVIEFTCQNTYVAIYRCFTKLLPALCFLTYNSGYSLWRVRGIDFGVR